MRLNDFQHQSYLNNLIRKLTIFFAIHVHRGGPGVIPIFFWGGEGMQTFLRAMAVRTFIDSNNKRQLMVYLS
jgi:hypothetical protein